MEQHDAQWEAQWEAAKARSDARAAKRAEERSMRGWGPDEECVAGWRRGVWGPPEVLMWDEKAHAYRFGLVGVRLRRFFD
eukprot:388854-Prymnesium_polylepis.1